MEQYTALKRKDILTWMNWGLYVKWNKSQRTTIAWVHLHGVPRMVRFLETESRRGSARGLGRGEKEWVFNGDGGSVWEDEQVTEMNGVDGCATAWMDLMLLTWTIKMVHFMLRAFCHTLKKVQTNEIPSWTEYHLRTQEIIQTLGQSVDQTLLNNFPWALRRVFVKPLMFLNWHL